VATNNTLTGADRGICGSEAVMINPDFRYALGANCLASYNRNRRRYAHHGEDRLRESNWPRPPVASNSSYSWPGIRACLLQYCNQLFFDHAWSCLDVSELDTGALTLAIPRLATAISVSSLQMVVRIIDENRRGQYCRNNQPIAKA
jgi:hypothetical protein